MAIVNTAYVIVGNPLQYTDLLQKMRITDNVSTYFP